MGMKIKSFLFCIPLDIYYLCSCNWFTYVMKRERGENPRQSRCCELPLICSTRKPLAICREGVGRKAAKSEDLPLP